jgi:hypothetical protein
MNWTELLQSKVEETFHATDGLIGLCEDRNMSWRPETGTNWMTQGQLLRHIHDACGMCMAGFVTGQWPMPADAKPDEMLPPADKLPSVKTVAEAKKALAADKKVALDMIAKAGEKDLGAKQVAAPWNPEQKLLGEQLLSMVDHLASHKSQLFYYLKLQGKPVHTGNLWGM